MKLPVLRLRLLPDLRCTRCGQLGYCEEKTTLCGACWNVSLLRYAKRKKARPTLEQIREENRVSDAGHCCR